jgi:hypothetical protein
MVKVSSIAFDEAFSPAFSLRRLELNSLRRFDFFTSLPEDPSTTPEFSFPEELFMLALLAVRTEFLSDLTLPFVNLELDFLLVERLVRMELEIDFASKAVAATDPDGMFVLVANGRASGRIDCSPDWSKRPILSSFGPERLFWPSRLRPRTCSGGIAHIGGMASLGLKDVLVEGKGTKVDVFVWPTGCS